jgi:acetyltransferase-like isoleucine patch superfamily enzyme
MNDRSYPQPCVNVRLALLVSGATLIFPWVIRRWLLNVICRYSIAKSAYIGWSLIGCPSLRMGSLARIGHFNIVKGIPVEMGESASIGDFNWISGASFQNTMHFKTETDRQPALRLERHAALTSRHFVDCSNLVDIGEFSTIAGTRSQILTHAIDFRRNMQVSASVRVGRFCFIGTGCIVLKGAKLPDYSILAAQSSLARGFDDPYTLYSGVPAVPVKGLDRDAAYFHRRRGFVD